MRLWSLHPSYLDSKGLVALWREGLLALHVLRGQTKGYRNHPQLDRFKQQTDPIGAIVQYLYLVADEATAREYSFNTEKLTDTTDKTIQQSSNNHSEKQPYQCPLIPVTTGQLQYEAAHLRQKLELRDPNRLRQHPQVESYKPHPIFKVIEGDKAEWER